MPNVPQPFKQHHLARALRAASSAGVPDPAVCVELPNGTKFHVGAAAGMPRAAASRGAPGKPAVAIRKPVPPPARTPRPAR
jgi:hypothetical protein